MSATSVTVLICTRDRPEQLAQCLKSILQLPRLPSEIIVVDNGSRKFEIPKLDYRIPMRFFSYPVPGLSRARNSVLNQVRGEILALIDDDAIASAAWLDAALAHFLDPRVGCVTGRILPMNPAVTQSLDLGPQNAIFGQDNFDPVTSVPGRGANLLVRMRVFQTARFPELFGPGTPVYAADEHYLFYQIIQSGWKICYEPNSVVYHEFSQSYEELHRRAWRRAISRGAFLTKFLLSEQGYRLHTLKYLLGRLFGKPGGMSDIPPATRNLGLLIGPIAILRSVLRNSHAYGSAAATLVSEIGP